MMTILSVRVTREIWKGATDSGDTGQARPLFVALIERLVSCDSLTLCRTGRISKDERTIIERLVSCDSPTFCHELAEF
jgi:hypothetical protein